MVVSRFVHENGTGSLQEEEIVYRLAREERNANLVKDTTVTSQSAAKKVTSLGTMFE